MKYYHKNQNNFGTYIDKAGERWQVSVGSRPIVGWEPFESLAECLEAWKLVYSPLPEEI